MELSNFDRNQIIKYLNSYARRINREPLDLFQKGQIFNYLNNVDNDINPKLGNDTSKDDENEVIVKTEIIKQEISDDKMKEIIKAVKAEINIKDGKDGKDGPELDDILRALQDDFEFIQKLKPVVPKWTGTGGLGERDVDRLIESAFISNADRIITAEIDINNIIENDKYIGNRLQLVVVDNDGNVVTEGGF